MHTLQRIGIHGVPRSGTSWLGQIVNSSPNVKYKYQPLFSYEFKSFLDAHSDIVHINKFFDFLEKTSSDFLDQVEPINKGLVPKFKKGRITHIVYKEVRYHNILSNLLKKDNSIKIIALIRNPLAVLGSWLNAPREFRKDLGWDITKEWRHAPKKNKGFPEEYFGYNKWKEATILFESLNSKYPERFLLLTYNELLSQTQKTVLNIFKFCDLALEEQTLEYITSSKSKQIDNAYSTYKIKEGDDKWRDILDAEIVITVINDLMDTPLYRYLTGNIVQ